MFAAINVTYFVYRDSLYQQVHGITMGSPVSPRLFLLFSFFTFSLIVICGGIIYCHSYTMTYFRYGLFPSPLVAISKFLLYHQTHKRMWDYSTLNYTDFTTVKSRTIQWGMKRVKMWTPLAIRRPALQGVIFGHHQKWGSPCCYCCLIWNLPLGVLSPSQCPHSETIVGATACKNPLPPSGHCLSASAGGSGWTDADGG